MSFQEFKILKNSGTYSETLEAYGLATLLDDILKRNNSIASKVVIEDNRLYYSVKANEEITEDMIGSLQYFPIFKFIKKDEKTEVPSGIIDYFDYPEQKKINDDFKERYYAICLSPR